MAGHEYAVIMAGGKGERFWPLSTAARPKQFLDIFDGLPLISHALRRLEGVVPAERTIVITGASLVGATKSALPSLPDENIIGEPMGRDTAAACALACGVVKARDPHGVVAILTADQLMADVPAFRRALSDCFAVAARGEDIVTMGITPTGPSTGFGYIELGADLDAGAATPFHKVLRFVEKPCLERAREYLASGRFRWNSGMFIWRVDVMAAALKANAPSLSQLVDGPATVGVDKLLADVYPGLDKISIDYAVMEKIENIVVADGDFGWDDVGTWPAVADHFAKDASGNVVIGDGVAMDSAGNIVVSRGGRKIALFGVDDLVVCDSGDAILVCRKDKAADLKKLVKTIQ